MDTKIFSYLVSFDLRNVPAIATSRANGPMNNSWKISLCSLETLACGQKESSSSSFIIRSVNFEPSAKQRCFQRKYNGDVNFAGFSTYKSKFYYEILGCTVVLIMYSTAIHFPSISQIILQVPKHSIYNKETL